MYPEIGATEHRGEDTGLDGLFLFLRFFFLSVLFFPCSFHDVIFLRHSLLDV